MKIFSFWEFSNPVKFRKLSKLLTPIMGICSILFLSVGLFWGLFYTPDDYRQGALVKIIYIHVPSAFLAINIYLMMFVASLIWLIRRHHLSALAAKAAAPIGLSMTVVAISTGALWGSLPGELTGFGIPVNIVCHLNSILYRIYTSINSRRAN